MLVLANSLWDRMVAHCLDGLPLEACGLIAGVEVTEAEAGDGQDGGVGHVRQVYPTANAARSARIYTVEPKDLLMADRAAEAAGLSIIGVWHSHTHTPAYPSPTDIAQAPDPGWHYVLVSLSDAEPVLRSFRIVGGQVEEEAVSMPYNGDQESRV